jgi:hypothetical protein
MTQRQPPDGHPESTDDERALVDALAVQPLTGQQLERLRVAVTQQWRAATAESSDRPFRNRRSRWLAVAAVVALVAVTAALLVAKPFVPATSIGSISRLGGGELEVRFGIFQRRKLVAGDALRVGDRFTTRGPVLVNFTHGGTLRMAKGTRVGVTAASQLSLDRGLVYLDFPATPSDSNPLRVITREGAVEHVGTEFEVMSNDQAVRIRVREGRIRFIGTSSTLVADAGTELLASGNKISQGTVDTYGRDWLWAVALAPDFDIEGRVLSGFLRWASRELGCRLEFADSGAREIADRTILHGAVPGRAPADALADVLATTSLTYEINGDTVWIRSGR